MTEQQFIDKGYTQINEGTFLDNGETVIVVIDPLTNTSRNLVFKRENDEWIFVEFSRTI